jgi:hypothetical protein
MAMRTRACLAVVMTLALGAVAAGCDDDTQEEVEEAAEEAREEVEEGAGEAGARAAAEAFRASLKAQETDDDAGGVRQVEALNEAAEDLPGDPDVSGIADGNGDGIDDDGLVEITVGDEVACVTLPESGNEIDVTGGACA